MAPASSVPPQLPPSVEEAYRRKCIQLKQRTNEVEEANDAARLRLARLKRQVEKMRLERAFLLEQLAKRTSTNVEDSDGSPSPPPTPKEKPLRIKRGHRKPSAMPNLDLPTAAGATFINQNLQTQSPSSDAFSAAHATNGLHKGTFRPLKPSSAFELYCDDKRAASKEKAAAAKAAAAASKEAAEGSGSPDDVDVDNDNDNDNDNENENENNGDNTDVEEETLSREWKDLPEDRRKEFEDRADRDAERYKKEKDAYDAAAKAEEEEAAAEKAATSASASAEAEAEAETADNKPSGGAKSDTGNKTDDAEGAMAEEMDVDRDADAETTTDERKASSSAKAADEGTDTPRATQEDVEMANNDTDDQETKAEQPQ